MWKFKVAYVLAQKHYRKVVIKTIRYSAKILDNKTHNMHQFLQNCVNDSTNIPSYQPYTTNLTKTITKETLYLKKKKGQKRKPSLWEKRSTSQTNTQLISIPFQNNLKITFSIYFTQKKSHFSWWLQNHQCSIMTASKLCQNLITKVKPKLAYFSLVCWYWWFSYSLVFKKKKIVLSLFI